MAVNVVKLLKNDRTPTYFFRLNHLTKLKGNHKNPTASSRRVHDENRVALVLVLAVAEAWLSRLIVDSLTRSCTVTVRPDGMFAKDTLLICKCMQATRF